MLLSQKFSTLLIGIALSAFALGWPSAACADFKGLWLMLGGKAVKDESIGSVDYTIYNYFGGSLSDPGYSQVGSYRQDGEGTLQIPSAKLMYLTTINAAWVGFAISADSHPERTIASQKQDIVSASGTSDYPRGFQMKTTLEAALDFQLSVEPGILLWPSLMAFVKIAYHQLDTVLKTEATIDGGLGLSRSQDTPTRYTFGGIGGGFGLRWMVTDKILVEPMVEFINFSPKTIPMASFDSGADEFTMSQEEELKLKWSMMSISLGYRF